MRKFIVGNWKMNGLAASLAEATAVAQGIGDAGAEVMLCPPATLIAQMRWATKDSALVIGAQDCHAKAAGAHTGDISAEMLADAGAHAVIVGHSERRSDHGETDADVRAKAEAARRAGLLAMICVGETEADRDAGRAEAMVAAQLSGSLPDGAPDKLVVAYEPVWAIGTGRVPGESDIRAMHAHIRAELVSRFGPAGSDVRILYGGSMKPDNAAAILAIPDVDGGLIGGASLKSQDFLAIVRAAEGVPAS
jgi:triosephosphate isomerase